MAAEYGVARNTVREALMRLADEDFVEIRAGSGSYVKQAPFESENTVIEQASPLELMDARFALEPHICRLCVLHGRRGGFEKLEALCLEMEACESDPVGFSKADTEFHRTLAEMTGNDLLTWIIRHVSMVRGRDEWKRMRRITLNEEIIAQYNAQHGRIVAAIRSREPERAANAMKAHLETAKVSLMRAAGA